MSTKYKFKNKDGCYFISFSTVGWIDVFTRRSYKDALVENLKYCQREKGLELFAWCIMTNHVHLIARAKEGTLLADIIRDFKKYTSRKIVETIRTEPESRREWLLKHFETAAIIHSKTKNHKVWQDGNHAIELYNERFTWTKVQYIHQNPVRAGLVTSAEFWKYSSASNYQEMISVFPEIYRLTPPLTIVK